MALMPGGVTGVNGRLRKNFDCRKVAYGCRLDGTLLIIYVKSRAGTLRAMAREGLHGASKDGLGVKRVKIEPDHSSAKSYECDPFAALLIVVLGGC